MMKKLIAVAGGVAILATAVMPVMAFRGRRPMPLRDVNDVDVVVYSQSTANTGGNTQSSEAEAEDGWMQTARAGGSQTIVTGNADSAAMASAMVSTDASCRCRRGRDCDCETSNVNDVDANVAADSWADTGLNHQEREAEAEDGCGQTAGDRGPQRIFTGWAHDRATAFAVVGTDIR
ncbi:MAG: hypothetical protein JW991_04025 [Candidatus Pacebacteria bacterium]|nr:hypothetical protein [Candidatus Paceibacterota bacterium]